MASSDDVAIPPQVHLLAERVRKGESVRVPVREVLSWFGVRERNERVMEHIDVALKSAGVVDEGGNLEVEAIDEEVRFLKWDGDEADDAGTPFEVPPQVVELAARVRREELVSVPIREVLSWFGVKRRGARVMAHINEVLEYAGLKDQGGALEAAGIDEEAEFFEWTGDSSDDELDAEDLDLDDEGENVWADASDATAPPVADSAQVPPFPAPWDPPNMTRPSRNVPYEGVDVWSAIGRRFTTEEAMDIARAIQDRETIPILTFVREALEPLIAWDQGVPAPWWFEPRIALTGPNLPGPTPAMLFVNHNGFYARLGDNPVLYEMTSWVPFDWVSSINPVRSEAAIGFQLTWTDFEGESGETILAEFFVPGFGCHMHILNAILSVWWPIALHYRDEPIVRHGELGETYRRFDSFQALLDWARDPEGGCGGRRPY